MSSVFFLDWARGHTLWPPTGSDILSFLWKLSWNQHTSKSISTWNTDVTWRQQQRPELPTVPLSHGMRVNARYTNSTRGMSSILSEIRLHSDSQAATFQLSQSKPGIPGPYTFLTFAKAVVNLYLQKLGVAQSGMRFLQRVSGVTLLTQ